MYFLLYISLGFVGFQLFNVLINFIFRQKISKTEHHDNELISILIPARNEETNIGNLLDALHKIKNNNIEIIVYNDYSTDNTEEIIKRFAENDTRVKLIDSEDLPKDWLGKNHACYKLAQQAKGKYLLFVDADVRLLGNIVSDAVSYLKKHKLGLLSVFPKQIQVSIGEKFTVPIMNYILLTLLPLIFVRISPFKSHSAANGQFMLFDAEIYKKLQPHEQFKSSAVEDIAISNFYKNKEIKIACITGEERIVCRMYNSYKEALKGFSKNIFMFFGNMPVVAFLFWTFATMGIVPLLIFEPQLTFIYLLAVILVQILYAFTCKQNPILTVLFFPIQLFFMLQVMIKAMIIKKKKNYTWKGRNIY